MDSLYLVMPAYNEEETIKEVVRQWYPVLKGKADNSRMVVADSGSSDKTHSILLSLKEEYPQLDILENTMKQHGPKLTALYKYAKQKEIDYVFQTDSDGQTNPAEFDAFWDLRKDYDAILGQRNARGDGKLRAFVEHMVCFILKIFFGIKVPDANAPFRLMKVDVVNKYINRFSSDYNLPNIMLTTYFAYYKEKLFFKEVSFKPRQGGVNSIDIPRIVKIGWKALGDFKAFKRGMQ